jgi:hypothetical protein
MTLTKAQAAEIVTAFGLILWRVYARLGDVWCDWLALTAIVWILSVILTGRRAWGPVMLLAASFLSAFYLAGRVHQW